jgi:hypothetical protein
MQNHHTGYVESKNILFLNTLIYFRCRLQTENFCVSGLCSSFAILNTRKRNISETGSVSETLCFLEVPGLRLVLSKGPNGVGVSFLLPEDGNRPNLRNVLFSVIDNSG